MLVDNLGEADNMYLVMACDTCLLTGVVTVPEVALDMSEEASVDQAGGDVHAFLETCVPQREVAKEAGER